MKTRARHMLGTAPYVRVGLEGGDRVGRYGLARPPRPPDRLAPPQSPETARDGSGRASQAAAASTEHRGLERRLDPADEGRPARSPGVDGPDRDDPSAMPGDAVGPAVGRPPLAQDAPPRGSKLLRERPGRSAAGREGLERDARPDRCRPRCRAARAPHRARRRAGHRSGGRRGPRGSGRSRGLGRPARPAAGCRQAPLRRRAAGGPSDPGVRTAASAPTNAAVLVGVGADPRCGRRAGGHRWAKGRRGRNRPAAETEDCSVALFGRAAVPGSRAGQDGARLGLVGRGRPSSEAASPAGPAPATRWRPARPEPAASGVASAAPAGRAGALWCRAPASCPDAEAPRGGGLQASSHRASPAPMRPPS